MDRPSSSYGGLPPSSTVLNLQLIMIRILRRRLNRLGSLRHLLLRLLRRRRRRFPYYAITVLISITHIHFPLILSGASLVVLALVSISLVFPVLLDEVCEILDGAGAGVGDWVVLAARGEELDGWEAGDLVGDVVGGGVDFGDGDLGGEGRGAGVHGGEFFVFGGQPGKK